MTANEPLPPDFGMAVDLGRVERELDSQMRGQLTDKAAPLQKVRMSNLVVFTSSIAAAQEIARQVPDIVSAHPARVILLIGDAAAKGDEIRTAVLVRCRMLTRTLQACSEQVTLYAADGMIDRLPFAVRSLLIGDLPINLLWSTPTPPPMGGSLLAELGEHALQILYDSLDWPDPILGVSATGTWLTQIERDTPGRWRVASDLNWRRLKYWRRLISQAIESFGSQNGDEIEEMQLEHGPSAIMQAWELAAWLTRRLGWRVVSGRVVKNVEMIWRFKKDNLEKTVRIRRLEPGLPRITHVRLAGRLDGKEAAMNLTPQGDARLVIELEGVAGEPRTITVPPHTPADIIGRQLSDRERDPVFRESMKVAQSMAQLVG